MITLRKALGAVCLAATVGGAVLADTLKVEHWLDFERVANPQIAPDGERVLYVRRRVDRMKDRVKSEVWSVRPDGSHHHHLVDGGAVRWSPSGDRIAFTKRDANGKGQLFVRYMDAEGAVVPVTTGDLTPRTFIWSPDGKSIAFTAQVRKDNAWRVKLPGKPRGAKWTDDPVSINTLNYRQDRVGLTNTGHTHLFVVTADGGTPRQITSGDWNVGFRVLGSIAGRGTISFSPDGEHIYFDGQPMEGNDTASFQSIIYRVHVGSGDITALTPEGGYFFAPQASPDGKSVAFIGAEAWASKTYQHGHLWVMDADGSNTERLIGDLPSTPGSHTWAPNSSGLYITVGDAGSQNLHFVERDGDLRNVTDGTQMIYFGSVSKDNQLAFTRTASNDPADVYIKSRRGEPTAITAVNDDILAPLTLGEVEEIWYDSTEGTRVQGWMVYPPNFDETQKYPLMLQIHGGPHAMYNTGFNFAFQEHAANGYIVLYTNPRGSTGYGAEFANAIQGMYPGPRDGMDLLNGVDAAIAKGHVDPERLFVTGCSGGGVLTTYVIAQTDRFKAAAARCPVTSWIGMAGYSDVPAWIYRFFEKPFWEDPAEWYEDSTLHMVGAVKTPTLLMTGDKDLRTPFEEAEQYFSALKMLGVPTRLVPMRGEYHGTGSIPSNWMRTQLYVRDWFKTYDPAHQQD